MHHSGGRVRPAPRSPVTVSELSVDRSRIRVNPHSANCRSHVVADPAALAKEQTMYVPTTKALGQAQLPTSSGNPCLQDKVPVEFIGLSTLIVDQSLERFNFRKSNLRTFHSTWIRRRFVPIILKGWRTTRPIRTIILVGHADEVGSPLDNYKLGLARAQAVRDRLLKELARQRPSITAKIAIRTFSSGECWPRIASGKREMCNRRVSVFAMYERLPARRSASPESPPTRRPSPTFDVPESVRKRIEREDEGRRLTQAGPALPRGRPLREWFDRIMDRHNVRKWLRDKIWDAILGGNRSLVGILLDQAGIRGESKEAILGLVGAGSQVLVR
jgi:outer membrane protein OmpA-like peptidoglycan-associated protein